MKIIPFLTAVTIALPALADVQLGPRPMFLVDQMADGPLKQKLAACTGPYKQTFFSIAHRGAPLQFPEHTREGYAAAARMGAGVQECDVTFTKDLELVCRHSQNDLHTTTNILTSDLAAKCTKPFKPAQGAECRTSDITLAEFRTLNGKMDAANKSARTVEAYMDGTAAWRTDLYAAQSGTLMTHAESIQMFKSHGAKFMPELKSPVVQMPFNGFTQEDYAQKLIDEYKAAGISPQDVYPQSFNLDDVLYWIEAEPDFGKQAVYLDASYRKPGWSPLRPATFKPSMSDLKAMGVNYIAPPMWVLVTLDEGKIVPSPYAIEAKKAGLKLITWTIERSGPLQAGGGWYYQSIAPVVKDDAAMIDLIHVLAQDVGVEGIFSDWPATVSYYANCMGLK